MSSISPSVFPLVKDNEARLQIDHELERRPVEILNLLGSVVTRHFFPKCTWDDIEECLIWCVERGLDPRPVKRMAKSLNEEPKI